MKSARRLVILSQFLLQVLLGGLFVGCAAPDEYTLIEGALTGTATASSQISTEFSADKATDGDWSTQWRSESQANPWILLSLGDAYSITGVQLTWGKYYASDYEIQISMDASEWTTIATLIGQNGQTDNAFLLNGTGKYVRIYTTTCSSLYDGVYLEEISVFGTSANNPEPSTLPERTPSTNAGEKPTKSDPSAPDANTHSTPDAKAKADAGTSFSIPNTKVKADASTPPTTPDTDASTNIVTPPSTPDAKANTDAGNTFKPSTPTDVALPPVNADFDYQLGGAYPPASSVKVVSRDRNDKPAPGLYNICYVNGFQAQQDENDFWLTEQPDLVLRDSSGNPVIDRDWQEMLLDITTESKRIRLADIMGGFFAGCASAGFVAVEVDNLDSYSRSGGRIEQDHAVAFMKLLSAEAHERGMAIAQKNSSDLVGRRAEMGTDFAIVEECNRYSECDAFREGYGDHVLIIEYRRADFDQGCAQYPGLSIVLRDVNLVTSGKSGYVFDGC